MFEGSGSRQQDLHGEDKIIRLTWSHESKLKECNLSPVNEGALGVKSHLRESKRDRILEILEIKNSLKISGILSKGILVGKTHFLPFPYISETNWKRLLDEDDAAIFDS